MQSKLNFLPLIVIIFSCSFCKNKVQTSIQEAPVVSATDEILKLHNLQRDYHFNKKVNEFVDLLTDDHISVSRGIISHTTKEANKARFTSYFASVEFQKWNDIEPPIIKFSEDSTLAYTIVHKQVELTTKDSTGIDIKESVEYAWMAIYRRTDNGWKIECVVSTDKG
jgi:hypothetical protein